MKTNQIQIKRAGKQDMADIIKIVSLYHKGMPQHQIIMKAQESAHMGCIYIARNEKNVLGFRMLFMSDDRRLMEYLFVKEELKDEVAEQLARESAKEDHKMNTLFLPKHDFDGFRFHEKFGNGENTFEILRRMRI